MPRSNRNGHKKYNRIQKQFRDRMKELTPSGVKPSSGGVIERLAEDWCLSEARIREILNMKLR
jgi:hypothetical protein